MGSRQPVSAMEERGRQARHGSRRSCHCQATPGAAGCVGRQSPARATPVKREPRLRTRFTSSRTLSQRPRCRVVQLQAQRIRARRLCRRGVPPAHAHRATPTGRSASASAHPSTSSCKTCWAGHLGAVREDQAGLALLAGLLTPASTTTCTSPSSSHVVFGACACACACCWGGVTATAPSSPPCEICQTNAHATPLLAPLRQAQVGIWVELVHGWTSWEPRVWK